MAPRKTVGLKALESGRHTLFIPRIKWRRFRAHAVRFFGGNISAFAIHAMEEACRRAKEGRGQS